METLGSTPPALTALQRRLLEVTTIVVGVTRIWARSRSLWDWDETLFSLGVGEYDVAIHHPHPPGFPLYLALAKLVRFFVHSDFHALQVVTTCAAIALFPLLFWLARELRFSVHTSYLGALLFLFFPDVWFFGGTAFSDIPGIALVVAANATLLMSCRARRAYFRGALLLGLAAAIRPQALVIGCAPALVASWCRIRERRANDVAVASAIGIAVLVVSYGGAALASESVGGYLEANRNLREYVRTVDSYLAPGRPSVKTLFPDFFVRVVPGGRIAIVVSAFAAISLIASLIRRTPGVWLLVAMFLPFNIMGLFLLDPNSISRYAIGYAAMYAILCADGIDTVFGVVAGFVGRGLIEFADFVVVGLIIGRFVYWTAPALRDVRATFSPPVAAMEWIHAHVPATDTVYVHASMGPFSDYMLRGFRTTMIEDPAELPPRPVTSHEWFITEGSSSVVDGHNFVRERGPMFNIARQRYFEVSVVPMTAVLRFGNGWYGSESVGEQAWRWMSGRSETLLPPIAGNAKLTIGFDVPPELLAKKPAISFTLNGQMIDRFLCTMPSVRRSWTVPARADRWNELVISFDKVINPLKEHLAPDPRDLALNLTSYAWTPAP